MLRSIRTSLASTLVLSRIRRDRWHPMYRMRVLVAIKFTGTGICDGVRKGWGRQGSDCSLQEQVGREGWGRVVRCAHATADCTSTCSELGDNSNSRLHADGCCVTWHRSDPDTGPGNADNTSPQQHRGHDFLPWGGCCVIHLLRWLLYCINVVML